MKGKLATPRPVQHQQTQDTSTRQGVCLLNKKSFVLRSFQKEGSGKAQTEILLQAPRGCSWAQQPLLPLEAPPAGGPDPCGGGGARITGRITGWITGTKLLASWAFSKLVSLTTG